MTNRESAKPSAARAKTPATADHLLSAADAYALYLPDAQALSAERVRSSRLDMAIVQNNLAIGLKSVEPEFPRLPKELPTLSVAELRALPTMLAAVRHAGTQVSALQTGSGDGFDVCYARARKLRQPLLDFADVLVQIEIFPAGPVNDIRAGSGSYDTGQDCIDLADLFTDYAAPLKNKSPFDDTYIAATRQAGLALTSITTPVGGRSLMRPELVAALDMKNRLWTLFEDAHQGLRKAGFYLFGDAITELVPLLGSRLQTTTGAAETEPTPEPQPGPSAESNTPAPPQ